MKNNNLYLLTLFIYLLPTTTTFSNYVELPIRCSWIPMNKLKILLRKSIAKYFVTNIRRTTLPIFLKKKKIALQKTFIHLFNQQTTQKICFFFIISCWTKCYSALWVTAWFHGLTSLLVEMSRISLQRLFVIEKYFQNWWNVIKLSCKIKKMLNLNDNLTLLIKSN